MHVARNKRSGVPALSNRDGCSIQFPRWINRESLTRPLIAEPVVNRGLKIGLQARSSSRKSLRARNAWAGSRRCVAGTTCFRWRRVGCTVSSTAPVRCCTPVRATVRALRPETIVRPDFRDDRPDANRIPRTKSIFSIKNCQLFFFVHFVLFISSFPRECVMRK